MLETVVDSLIDTLKLVPFLFISFLIIELLEHKFSNYTKKIIEKAGYFGPLIGSSLGIFPQCGFSAAAANLYAGRIITLGSLVAIFLSTSDEMLPILISEAAPINLIIKILLIKLIIGMLVGVIIDFIIRKKSTEKDEEKIHIHDICEVEHCHCEEDGNLKSSIKHTLHIFVYILIIMLVINMLITFIGEENIAKFITAIPVLGPVVSTIIGIIPNCASSIIITQLYLRNMITFGSLIAGLLVNSGIGMLVLFKVNKSKKENLKILAVLSVISMVAGIIIDII